jgi:hypothetical protein
MLYCLQVDTRDIAKLWGYVGQFCIEYWPTYSSKTFRTEVVDNDNDGDKQICWIRNVYNRRVGRSELFFLFCTEYVLSFRFSFASGWQNQGNKLAFVYLSHAFSVSAHAFSLLHF